MMINSMENREFSALQSCNVSISMRMCSMYMRMQNIDTLNHFMTI